MGMTKEEFEGDKIIGMTKEEFEIRLPDIVKEAIGRKNWGLFDSLYAQLDDFGIYLDYEDLEKLEGAVTELMESDDEKGRKAGKLKGRYFSVAVADGGAYYRVLKENKNTIQVRWIPFASYDDYIDDVIGYEGTIPKRVAESAVNFRDCLEAKEKKVK